MMNSKARLALAGIATLCLSPLGANAQPAPGVTVNGQAVTLTPAPITRGGRVFVPLRGVFQQLGATVVYQNGDINATGGSHTVALHIGSTSATVDGQPQQLDVAPFVVGASTYVPLRFVSQALGATVQYAGGVVALTTAGGAPNEVITPVPAAPTPYAGAVLRAQQPGVDTSVGSTRPTISADFVRQVDPNSVRVHLDGLDITNDTTRSPSGFVYAPPSPLQNMPHTVAVDARIADGPRVHAQWQFASGSEPPKNTVRIEGPHEGDQVAATFKLSGHTLPNARIHIVAGARASFGGPFAFGAGTYTGDTIANADGFFSQDVALQTVSGAVIGLTVLSTDPVTKESAEARLNLREQ